MARTIVTQACKVLAALGLGMLLVVAFFTMFDGTLRFAINRPIDLVREIGDLVSAIAVACCLPIALLHHSNITLRALGGISSPRLLRAVEVFADLVVLLVMAGIAWQFLVFAQKTQAAGDVTWMMNLPKAPFWYVVSALLAFGALTQLVATLDTLAGRTPEHGPEGIA